MNVLRVTLFAAAGLMVAGCATAGHPTGGHPTGRAVYDWAEVIDAQPVYAYERVPVSREVCWDEEVRHSRSGGGNTAGTVLGGLIGGLAGHQVGSGSGNTAATVVGTLAGAAVGNQASRGPSRDYYSVEERCRVERDYREEERLTGYRVTYLYNGETYTTRTRHDPGAQIRVRVSVSPAE